MVNSLSYVATISSRNLRLGIPKTMEKLYDCQLSIIRRNRIEDLEAAKCVKGQ